MTPVLQVCCIDEKEKTVGDYHSQVEIRRNFWPHDCPLTKRQRILAFVNAAWAIMFCGEEMLCKEPVLAKKFYQSWLKYFQHNGRSRPQFHFEANRALCRLRTRFVCLLTFVIGCVDENWNRKIAQMLFDERINFGPIETAHAGCQFWHCQTFDFALF